MRLATVGSQAGGTSIASRSGPDIPYQRAYVSCTTSSASASEPSIRYDKLVSEPRSLITASRAALSPGSSELLIGTPYSSPVRHGSRPAREVTRRPHLSGRCPVEG